MRLSVSPRQFENNVGPFSVEHDGFSDENDAESLAVDAIDEAGVHVRVIINAKTARELSQWIHKVMTVRES